MKKDGFTLLEVILFMAISSSLALIAFASMGPRLRNVRFTDSVRGLESSITSAVAESQQGKNAAGNLKCEASAPDFKVSSGGSQGSSGDCVFNGLFIFFDENENRVRYQQVVSLREKKTGCPAVITEAAHLYQCFGTRPLLENENFVERSTDNYYLTNGLDQTTGGGNFIVYATNPETGEKYTYLFRNGAEVNDFSICYELDTRRANLTFSKGTIEPKVEFNKC